MPYSKIKGIAASPGVVVAPVFIHRMVVVDIPEEPIKEDAVLVESGRFREGRERAREQLEEILEKAKKNLSEDEVEVFEGHIEILMDEDLEEEILNLIRNSHYPALKAVSEIMSKNVEEMEALDDDYMRERASDIKDIGQRLLFAVAGRTLPGLDSISIPSVIIAHDLVPSETAVLDRTKVLGFITETGGKSSHVAIMAKSLEIPAIVGAGDLLDKVEDDDIVAMDATAGDLILCPTPQQQQEFSGKIKEWKRRQEELSTLRDLPAQSTDGHRVEIAANIGTNAEVEGVLRHGAEGIGLFRTEFLFMDRNRLPTEDEQFEAYKSVAKDIKPRPVIIRTMDIGGDKELAYLNVPKEDNPFLGWRAIRMCLDRPDMFKTQLRAILRASVFGKIRVMFPMIDSLREVYQAKSLIKEAGEELRTRGESFDENMEMGVMIETPAAAVIASHLIKEVDFFSIGTNDLTQYTLAVDRGNTMIAPLYQPMHPAVLTLIKNIIDTSHAAGKWTGICGELASDEAAALILVGMGVDELSMSAVDINKVKKVIREHSMSEMKAAADEVLTLGTTSAIMERVNRYR